MNKATGEVRMMTQAEADKLNTDLPMNHPNRYVKVKEPWWVETKVEPTKKQLQSGLKGWHKCLCGSGKLFRECCRVKTPYVKRSKNVQA
jgi:uncharacterized protein YchJ